MSPLPEASQYESSMKQYHYYNGNSKWLNGARLKRQELSLSILAEVFGALNFAIFIAKLLDLLLLMEYESKELTQCASSNDMTNVILEIENHITRLHSTVDLATLRGQHLVLRELERDLLGFFMHRFGFL